MSIFTGKYDFYDFCNMNTSPEDLIKKLELFIGPHKIDINTAADLFLYGTHLVSVAGGESNGNQRVVLCTNSHIDAEEEDTIRLYIYNAIKYNRIWKSNYIKYDAKAVLESLIKDFPYESPHVLKEIVDIVDNHKSFMRLPVYLLKDKRFMITYLIPKYFFHIRTATATKQRERFLQTFKEKYGPYEEDGLEYINSIIGDFYRKVKDFHTVGTNPTELKSTTI